MTLKRGRPRVEVRKEFSENFARVLPGLREGSISKGEAAKKLGISHRSLNRYLEQESGINNSNLLTPDKVVLKGFFRRRLRGMYGLSVLLMKRVAGKMGGAGT